jgi:hypothetical protein
MLPLFETAGFNYLAEIARREAKRIFHPSYLQEGAVNPAACVGKNVVRTLVGADFS